MEKKRRQPGVFFIEMRFFKANRASKSGLGDSEKIVKIRFFSFLRRTIRKSREKAPRDARRPFS